MVEKLLSLNADALSANNHDTVLHRAVMSVNPEITKRIIEKIKAQHANTLEIIHAVLNARDKEVDSPLMCAVQGQNANVLEVLLQEGADFQTAILEGITAFNMAVRTTYPPVDRSNKNAIKIWKVQIEHQKKIIDLLYLKTHSLSNNRAMKARFSILINEEFRAYVSHLEFESLKTLHNTLDQTGNIAFWSLIAGKVKKRIEEEYPDITLNTTTQSETPALRDLMRTFAWVSLETYR